MSVEFSRVNPKRDLSTDPLFVCSGCGAVVDSGLRQLHTVWHDRVQLVEVEVENEIVQLVARPRLEPARHYKTVPEQIVLVDKVNDKFGVFIGREGHRTQLIAEDEDLELVADKAVKALEGWLDDAYKMREKAKKGQL